MTTSWRLRTAALALGLPGTLWAADAPGSAAQAERARIAAERVQAQRRFEAEQTACYARFAVNDCIAAAAARQRNVLSDLRRQEIQLNDEDRRRRTADRLRQNEERQQEQRQREARPPARRVEPLPAPPAAVSAPAPVPAPAPAPQASAARPLPTAPPPPPPPASSRPRTAGVAADPAQPSRSPPDTQANRRRHEARLKEARERKERAAARAAESRKDKRPLPVPP